VIYPTLAKIPIPQLYLFSTYDIFLIKILAPALPVVLVVGQKYNLGIEDYHK